MSKPISGWSHLIRLGILLTLAIAAFITARTLARPASWNSVVWYRQDALKDIAGLPVIYGGNDSCAACHGTEQGIQLGPGHLGLSCESCHGPLADHMLGEEKIADAIVVSESDWQCMNCHSEMINRPVNFSVYRYQHGENRVRRQKSERGGKFCLDCHDPHAPELEGPVL